MVIPREDATWNEDILPLVPELLPDVGIKNEPIFRWNVLRVDGVVVAGVAVKPLAPGRARLRCLFVRRPYRNQGLGSGLLDQVEEMLVRRGIHSVFASVLSDLQHGQEPAMAFYVKRGFVVHLQRKHGAMMVKHIGPA